MSMLPYNFGYGDCPALFRPGSLFDQNFGHGVGGLTVGMPSMFPHGGYIRPWRFLEGMESGISKIIDDKDKFEVSLDVKQFKPEEISVKNVDNVITVEGKHEEKQDEHGLISRHFTRRYVLPKEVDVEKCKVQLTSDGILILNVPKKALTEADKKKGRQIPITQTGAPAVKAAEAKK